MPRWDFERPDGTAVSLELSWLFCVLHPWLAWRTYVKARDTPAAQALAELSELAAERDDVKKLS